MRRADDHTREIRPLLSAASWMLVDGRPICHVCGLPVRPVGCEWRHDPNGRLGRRPRWLAPITLDAMLSLGTYETFAARFPWVARPDMGAAFPTSENQWREAVRRLECYRSILRSVRGRRTLRTGENPYLRLVEILAAPSPLQCLDVPGAASLARRPDDWSLPRGLSQVLALRERRRELAAVFAWAIPTEEALDLLARYAPLVEGGAGMGYWTALLQARGVDAVAYDAAPPGALRSNAYHARGRSPWTAVQEGSSVTAVQRHRARTLLLCWPPHDDDEASYAALLAYRGDALLYIGEGADGATGSVRFHRELDLNWTVLQQIDLPHWPRLRDRVTVLRRNATRRAHRERDRCDECRRFARTGSIGRCEQCFERRPPALALEIGGHRVEYARATLDAMPAALRRALETSSHRIR